MKRRARLTFRDGKLLLSGNNSNDAGIGEHLGDLDDGASDGGRGADDDDALALGEGGDLDGMDGESGSAEQDGSFGPGKVGGEVGDAGDVNGDEIGPCGVGEDGDSVALLEGGDGLADLHDDAGGLATRDGGEGGRGKGERREVCLRDGEGVDADEKLGRGGRRRGWVRGVEQGVRGIVLVTDVDGVRGRAGHGGRVRGCGAIREGEGEGEGEGGREGGREGRREECDAVNGRG